MESLRDVRDSFTRERLSRRVSFRVSHFLKRAYLGYSVCEVLGTIVLTPDVGQMADEVFGGLCLACSGLSGHQDALVHPVVHHALVGLVCYVEDVGFPVMTPLLVPVCQMLLEYPHQLL